MVSVSIHLFTVSNSSLLFLPFSFLPFMTKRYTLQQKCQMKWNRNSPPRNTMVQLNPLHRSWAPQYTLSQTDRQTDKQTDRRQYDANACSTIG